MPAGQSHRDQVRSWQPQDFFSHTLVGASVLERVNAEGGLAVDFQAARRSPIHLAFEGCQSATLSVWATRSTTGFVSRPKFEADLFSLRFVEAGSLVRRNRRGDAIVGGHGQALFLPYDVMHDENASTGFSALAATVTRAALLSACEALEQIRGVTLPQFLPVVDVVTREMLALKLTLTALHRRLKAGTRGRDLLLPLMEEILVYQVLTAWPRLHGSVEAPARPAGKPSVQLAIDYMNANLARQMTIAEIASAAGVGVRALQVAFREQLHSTPIQYLIGRRLDGVNQMLRAPTGTMTIAQIAAQMGFVHMSDFTRRYRERFGYTPAMTPGRKLS